MTIAVDMGRKATKTKNKINLRVGLKGKTNLNVVKLHIKFRGKKYGLI